MFYGRCGDKIRKLMTTNLYTEDVFQILCGHWFWAVEKISWLHDRKTIGSFRMSKMNWRREEWVQV